jgi:hypothetical protein
MSDDSGKMPEQFIDRPGPPFVQLKVKYLKPEHGEGFIGVGDVAVDTNRQCWVLLDAPVFGADFRDVAPLILRRTRDAGYEIQMGGLPDESNFKLIPSPDVSTWVRVQVVEAPGPEGTPSA